MSIVLKIKIKGLQIFIFNLKYRQGFFKRERVNSRSLFIIRDSIMKEEINRHEILEQITPLIENTAMRYNLIPVEIEFVKENHRWYLRVYLFSYDHPVTLEDCENVTRSMEDFLDELIPCKYYLEVSSPGLERKFKSEKEYIIFRGRNVSIKLKEQPTDGSEQIFKAKLVEYDENEGITVIRLKDEKEMIIPMDKIKNTRLYYE